MAVISGLLKGSIKIMDLKSTWSVSGGDWLGKNIAFEWTSKNIKMLFFVVKWRINGHAWYFNLLWL